MRQLLSQIVSRPVADLTASLELLRQRMKSGQRIDGIISRIIHTLSRGSDEGVNRSSPLIAEQKDSRGEAAVEAQSEARCVSRDEVVKTPGGRNWSEASVATAGARAEDSKAASRSYAGG